MYEETIGEDYMRIAICDDNLQDIEKIRIYTMRMTDYAVEYKMYSEAVRPVEDNKAQKVKADMYIPDIEMQGMNGLSVAKKIRSRNPEALIVFLTGYTKYMPDVFEVVTFDYIKKPITEERLRLLLFKAETYLKITDQHFAFQYLRSRYSLNMRIFYI